MELEPGEIHAAAAAGGPSRRAVRHSRRHKGDISSIDPSLQQVFIVNPFSINADAKFSKINPYTHIYGKYDQAPDLQPMYKREGGLAHPFQNLTRIKLIQLILESKEAFGARLEPLAKMKAEGRLAAYYPLHDRPHLHRLKTTMMRERRGACRSTT